MDELKKYSIHHVGLVVPDLDATVQHWKDYYGVTDFKYWTFNPMKAWVYGQPVEEYKLNVAMGTIHPGGCNVEIISPITEYGYHYDFVKSGKTGLNHICFSTDNYDSTRAHFLEKCGTFLFEAEIEDDIVGYRRCFYAEDTSGDFVYEIREVPYFRK